MSEQPLIDVFSKPSCSYCTRAKAVLRERGLRWTEHDVASSARARNASIYVSGTTKVPQIFIGGYPVNGAVDLEQLHASGRLDALLAAADPRGLPLDGLDDATLAEGAEDLPARTAIPKSDGTHDDDPEAWPILRFYKTFFGFWPNTFAYLHHWPEAYKLFMYGHNFAAIGAGRRVLGDPLMLAVAYGTSQAQGCTYCQTHAAAFAGEKSLGVVRAVQQALAADVASESALGPYERSLVQVATRAALGPVPQSVLGRPRALLDQARGPVRDVEADIDATALVVSAFGFLNVFNDLVGMQVEGDWADLAGSVGIDAGRHGTEDGNPNNLDHELPTGGPSLERMLQRVDDAVGDLERHWARELGVAPAWMKAMPAEQRRRHAYFYTEVMGDRPHSVVPAELKHLMARVSAIAKGHGHLAAVEAYMAQHVATEKSRALTRIESCYGVATGRIEPAPFTAEERAALVLAWLSAQTPLVTPRRFLQPALDAYDAKGMIELFTVCGVASLVQRFCAIRPQPMEPAVTTFLDANGLERDPLALRHPLPARGAK